MTLEGDKVIVCLVGRTRKYHVHPIASSGTDGRPSLFPTARARIDELSGGKKQHGASQLIGTLGAEETTNPHQKRRPVALWQFLTMQPAQNGSWKCECKAIIMIHQQGVAYTAAISPTAAFSPDNLKYYLGR